MGNYGGDALCTTETTIASGASLSSAISLQSNATTYCGLRIFGIIMPSEWTSANLTFQVSADGVTYQNLYDANGTEITVVAGASRTIQLDPAVFAAIPYIKVRSGTSGTAVNQGAARTIGLILRGV